MFYFCLKIRSLGIVQSTFSNGPNPPFSALSAGHLTSHSGTYTLSFNTPFYNLRCPRKANGVQFGTFWERRKPSHVMLTLLLPFLPPS